MFVHDSPPQLDELRRFSPGSLKQDKLREMSHSEWKAVFVGHIETSGRNGTSTLPLSCNWSTNAALRRSYSLTRP